MFDQTKSNRYYLLCLIIDTLRRGSVRTKQSIMTWLCSRNVRTEKKKNKKDISSLIITAHKWYGSDEVI